MWASKGLLDNDTIYKQHDPSGALEVAASEWNQIAEPAAVENAVEGFPQVTSVIVTGMGGSALAALVAATWLKEVLNVPFTVVRSYDLPAYVDHHSLVIASSYSGNTEETVSALEQAMNKKSHTAILASGGQLIEIAEANKLPYVKLTGGLQPRMAVFYNLMGLVAILENYGVVKKSTHQELLRLSDWLRSETHKWVKTVPTADNQAKQIALEAVGKTPVFYGGALTAPVAYKWKISWNETAKNMAFWNEYSEFNHNEFMGWTSHPIEKPFVVFDLISNFEHPQILKRFEISDRLLSGLRPKANRIELEGHSPLAQMLWGSILADFASMYTAMLNGVDPVPVDLIEKLKKELV